MRYTVSVKHGAMCLKVAVVVRQRLKILQGYLRWRKLIHDIFCGLAHSYLCGAEHKICSMIV
jgi:hypothetical protein